MARSHHERSMTDRIDRVLANSLRRDEPIADDLALADLGVDSLGMLSVLMSLEDEFGVLMPVELLSETGCMRTVGDLRAIAAEALSDDHSGGRP